MISIIGLGFVGGAMLKSFSEKGVQTIGYDKYKDGGIGTLEATLSTEIMFLCLPTLLDNTIGAYNKDAINDVCKSLEKFNYDGLIVIKSTIEPETTDILSNKYPSLRFCHNPEFLTARTAYEDFHNQKHIVIGRGIKCSDDDIKMLKNFYNVHYPGAEISICTSLESESMKIFCNSFYASKIMLFNEYYLLCQKNGSDFNKIRDIMLKNDWINPMHTNIPGPDGQLGYGGACFPKDTQALRNYMKEKGTNNTVISAVIDGNNTVRQ